MSLIVMTLFICKTNPKVNTSGNETNLFWLDIVAKYHAIMFHVVWWKLLRISWDYIFSTIKEIGSLY